jgi:type IV secretory pathway VirB6-like protein
VRKKAAKQVSRALPDKKSPGGKAAERIANDLSKAAADIRDLVTGGPRKRSKAAKKAAKTRKANQKKRSQSAKKGAKTRKSGKG